MKTQWCMVALSAVIGLGAAVLAPSKAQATTKCCLGQASEGGVGSCGIPCNYQPTIRDCNMQIFPGGFVNAHISISMTPNSPHISSATTYGDTYQAYSPGVRLISMCAGDSSAHYSSFGWPGSTGGAVTTRTCPSGQVMNWAQCQAQAPDNDPSAYVIVNGQHAPCNSTCQ